MNNFQQILSILYRLTALQISKAIVNCKKQTKCKNGGIIAVSESEIQMHGYINMISMKRRFVYIFEDSVMTVYSRNSLPFEHDDININLDCDIKYIFANDLRTGNNIIFFVDEIPFSDERRLIFTSTTIRVHYYIELIEDFESFIFDKAIFRFKELDAFFPITNGIKREIIDGKVLKIETVPYEDTKKKFTFDLLNKKIDAELAISSTLCLNQQNQLLLSSVLGCSFEETQNINLLLDLYKIIKRLFCFLCHRQSIKIEPISLRQRGKNSRSVPIGKLHILFDKAEIEKKEIIDETIKYSTLSSHFSELIQLVSNDKLYFEHIPTNHYESQYITVSSFILNSAAFEWNFEQCYGDIPVSEYRLEVKNDILDVLEKLIVQKKYNSKKKRELKLYSKIVKNVDRKFSEKVLYALKDFDDILSVLIKQIYRFNNMTFHKNTYKEIAEDLQYQRNAYAHGDIDKELKENYICDTIILEWLDYCMVFKSLGYSNDEIFNIINAIFNRRFRERKGDQNT